MSSAKKPVCISILPPPESTGTFKITILEDRSITATLSKQGKVDNTPTHIYNPDTKKWEYLDNNIRESMFSKTGNLLTRGRI